MASAVKWLQRWYQSRERRPEAVRGGRVSPLEEFAVEILDLIAQRPDLTLVETVAELRKRRIKTSRSSLWRFLDSTGNITLKKCCKQPNGSEQMWRERAAAGYESKGMLDPARLVFIDETAVQHGTPGETERASPAWRPGDWPCAVPLGRWETITFVAALRHNKMVAPMVVEGAMTGEMFLAYALENCLVPTLRRNDIVVMDNCRVHLGPALARLSKQWARHCVTC